MDGDAAILLVVLVVFVIVAVASTALAIFCIASMTWGAWRAIQFVWQVLFPARVRQLRRGFEVVVRQQPQATHPGIKH